MFFHNTRSNKNTSVVHTVFTVLHGHWYNEYSGSYKYNRHTLWVHYNSLWALLQVPPFISRYLESIIEHPYNTFAGAVLSSSTPQSFLFFILFNDILHHFVVLTESPTESQRHDKDTWQSKQDKIRTRELSVLRSGWAGHAAKTRCHVLCDGGSWLRRVCLALVCWGTTVN